jgi:hypothetical protein
VVALSGKTRIGLSWSEALCRDVWGNYLQQDKIVIANASVVDALNPSLTVTGVKILKFFSLVSINSARS